MKRLPFLCAIFVLAAVSGLAQYKQVTLRQIQEVSLDSLKVADLLQNRFPSRYTLQTSPLMRNKTTGAGDTVTVLAVVAVPQGVVTFDQAGWTMVLVDTGANPYPWGAIEFRLASRADTSDADLAGFRTPTAGSIVKVTGVVGEFPTTSYMNSLTELNWLKGTAIEVKGTAPIPKPVRLTVGDFYKGLFPGGYLQFSTGEKYEGCYVELTNLTVISRVNFARGTFSMVDADGNEVSEYDVSRFYTKGHSSNPTIADTTWPLIYPQVGTHVDTIRGYMWTASGGENPRGYRISPIYRSDLVLGTPIPVISAHRRNPVVVSPDSAARISVKVDRPYGGSPIGSVKVLYSVNNQAFSPLTMSYQASDTTYVASIPQQAANSTVRYFIEAADTASRVARLANSSLGSLAPDTSKGFFFYQVLNRALTIQDIQNTPYVNGRSPYLGGVVTLRGVVTADTASINISAPTVYSTSAWYMQSGNAPWSGIWVTASSDTTLRKVRVGDSIAVTGTVQEATSTGSGDVTRIGNVSTPVTIVASGVPLPAPVVKPTGDFAAGAYTTAEPWESMLVRFVNVTVVDLYPNFSEPLDYLVDDGSGPSYVRQDGKNTWSNVATDTALGKKILKVGDKISSLTGVMFYGFNHYKLVPRTNADFGVVTSVDAPIRFSERPSAFTLDQNYPNPFNPTTVIRYGLPTAGLTTLKVYNVLGQEAATLVNEVQAPGTYTVRFNASSLSSGVYFFRIQSGSFSAVKKMVLLK